MKSVTITLITKLLGYNTPKWDISDFWLAKIAR
jgi:hypothetical protein